MCGSAGFFVSLSQVRYEHPYQNPLTASAVRGFCIDWLRLEKLNSTVRWTVDRCRSPRQRHLYFLPIGKKMQTSLATWTIGSGSAFRTFYRKVDLKNAKILKVNIYETERYDRRFSIKPSAVFTMHNSAMNPAHRTLLYFL